MILANAARGEIVRRLGGRERRLCLTLGALAQIETMLEARDFQDLVARLSKPSARQVLAALSALLEAGEGAAPLGPTQPEELARSAVTLAEAGEAIAAAFAAGLR